MPIKMKVTHSPLEKTEDCTKLELQESHCSAGKSCTWIRDRM